MTADIWGLCEFCERWFSCAEWFDKEAPQPCCPVCRAEPSAIENRSAAGRQGADRAHSSFGA